MRRVLPVLLLAASVVACSDDSGVGPAAPAEAATCSRVSATDLSAVLGEDLTVQDVSEGSGIEGATVCAAAGPAVVVNWIVEPEPTQAPSDSVDEATIRVSAQGEAADGRTTTATVVRNAATGGPDISAATMLQAAEAVVAAYAEEGEPAPGG